MQLTPTKTQRDEEINQLKQMEMVESLRVARDSQRLAEVSRIEAEKRCVSLHETAFAALQARAHAAERNTEFMQFALIVLKQTASARPPGPIPAPGELPEVLPADEDG